MRRRRGAAFLRWRSALAGALLAITAPAQADVLVDNVEGLTLNASGEVERFTGLLIGDDGRIEQVLSRGDKRPRRFDYLVDGKGRVLIPGMIDAHAHVMELGLARLGQAAPGTTAQPRPEDRDIALAEAQQFLLARGITAVADMGTTIEDWQAYRRAGDLGTLRMRIMSYAQGVDAMALIGGPGPTPWLYDDRLRLNGVLLELDGTLDERGAALKAAYADAPGKTGTPRLSDTQLRNLMSRAAIDNFQPAVVVRGDRATAMVLDALDELTQTYRSERRWRLEQVQAVDPLDLPRLRGRGLVVSMQPLQQASGRGVAEARLGPEWLAGAYAWNALAGAGAVLAFGSGAPMEPADPFAGMAAAITRQDAQSQPFGGWQPQERLTREAALAAYTTGAAYAGFADGRFGRLTAGQRADFLLVDRDPLLASPSELRGLRVLQTWVGGKLVYEASPAAAPAAPRPADQTGGR